MKQIRRDEIRIADRLDETACQLEDDANAVAGGGGQGPAPTQAAERYRKRADTALAARRHLIRLDQRMREMSTTNYGELQRGLNIADWLVQQGWTPPDGIEVEE